MNQRGTRTARPPLLWLPCAVVVLSRNAGETSKRASLPAVFFCFVKRNAPQLANSQQQQKQEKRGFLVFFVRGPLLLFLFFLAFFLFFLAFSPPSPPSSFFSSHSSLIFSLSLFLINTLSFLLHTLSFSSLSNVRNGT